MSYQRQNVLPANFEPPSVRGLGVTPPANRIVSGDVPAFPHLLPTLDTFTAGSSGSGASRAPQMIPSYTPRAPGAAPLWHPSNQAGVMPSPVESRPYAWGARASGRFSPAARSGVSGVGEYRQSPTPYPLTATWGLRGAGYRPVGLGGCAGCGLGQVTWPFPGVPMWPAVIGAALLGWWLLRPRLAYSFSETPKRRVWRKKKEA
jgi:hypothetical protein